MVTEADFKQIGAMTPDMGRASVIRAQDDLGRVLLQIRDNFDFVKMGGWLGYFGGHVEAGEDLDEAAAREFEEETGIFIDKSELIPRLALVSPSNDQMLHYVFELKRRIQATEIVVCEGAGFVFLERSQFDSFPVLPAVILAEQHLDGEMLGA